MPRAPEPDYAGGRFHRRYRLISIYGLVLGLGVCGAEPVLDPPVRAATPARKPVTKAGPAAVAPAAKPVPPPPGFQEMSQLSFLAGNWVGQLKAMPIYLDISIKGAAEKLGGPLRFQIHAEPPKDGFMKMGLEGDYRAEASYSQTLKAVRAVLTDTGGRGVEMLGAKEATAEAWLFNSTAQGAPFPFKVRVKPIGTDQIVVAYSSGGRLPLKYEIVFNRVDG